MQPHERILVEGSRQEFLELAAEFDAPAFVRRALYTSECEQALIDQCSLKRQQLLEMSRTRLARLGQLIGGRWERLRPCLLTNVHCSPSYLQQLHDEWRPTLRLPLQVSFADRPIRRALQDLSISFVHFNRKWQRFVDELDLEHINQVRLDYNNYYVLEKACAFRSERLGQAGFQPLRPYTKQDIWTRFTELVDPLAEDNR